ncbi:MAG: hypothetical protein HFH15_15510 [Ruminococcus sp.]|jgi:hypothetical protein|nr:hypothetical protein [Ruminococcus sp.]
MVRKKKNWIQTLILLIGLLLLLSGCTKFDACAYMQAILDVSYKNETESYMEITGVTQEEADEIFKKNLDATMHEFSTTELPEELEENYRLLFEDTVKQVKYTVGEAVESEDKNYTVEVAVEPILLFDETYEEFQNKTEEYASEISNNVMSGEELPSDDEIQNQVYQTYYEVLKTALNNGLSYGEAENITVHMNRMEDGAYEIPEEDLRALDQAMISQEKLE